MSKNDTLVIVVFELVPDFCGNIHPRNTLSNMSITT